MNINNINNSVDNCLPVMTPNCPNGSFFKENYCYMTTEKNEAPDQPLCLPDYDYNSTNDKCVSKQANTLLKPYCDNGYYYTNQMCSPMEIKNVMCKDSSGNVADGYVYQNDICYKIYGDSFSVFTLNGLYEDSFKYQELNGIRYYQLDEKYLNELMKTFEEFVDKEYEKDKVKILFNGLPVNINSSIQVFYLTKVLEKISKNTNMTMSLKNMLRILFTTGYSLFSKRAPNTEKLYIDIKSIPFDNAEYGLTINFLVNYPCTDDMILSENELYCIKQDSLCENEYVFENGMCKLPDSCIKKNKEYILEMNNIVKQTKPPSLFISENNISPISRPGISPISPISISVVSVPVASVPGISVASSPSISTFANSYLNNDYISTIGSYIFNNNSNI